MSLELNLSNRLMESYFNFKSKVPVKRANRRCHKLYVEFYKAGLRAVIINAVCYYRKSDNHAAIMLYNNHSCGKTKKLSTPKNPTPNQNFRTYTIENDSARNHANCECKNTVYNWIFYVHSKT